VAWTRIARYVVSAALIAGAWVLWSKSFTATTTTVDGDLIVHHQTTCEDPIRIALSRRSDRDWFAYAPNTGVTFSTDGPDCTNPARIRAAVGAAFALGAIALIAVPPIRNRFRRTGE
jgi:hypothetical protein